MSVRQAQESFEQAVQPLDLSQHHRQGFFLAGRIGQ
jgi:hypothetical protein